MSAGAAPGPAQLTAFARQVYPTLDKYSYYQLLQVTPAADASSIRASYYRIAGQLHPDRYHGLPDAQVREQLETIYARVTEAYRVLLDRSKRAVYDAGLPQGKMRYDNTGERKSHAPRNPEDTINHAEAKKFFRLGLLCMGRKDWKGAVMNLNFARNYEPGAAVINEKLAEAQAAAKGGGSPPK